MPKKLLLVIGLTWPEPTATAAGNRMLQLVDFFLEQNYKVVFSSTAKETERSVDFGKVGVKKAPILLNDSSFDVFIENLDPEIVLFDRFLTEEQFGWRVAEFAPRAIRILDTEDLHSLRDTRENLLKKEVNFKEELWLQNTITKREIASIYRSDLSLIISSFEMDLLVKHAKIDSRLLLFLPFLLPKIQKEVLDNWTPFPARKDFIFIGNGRHAPNIDAIVWLKKEIWPKIATNCSGAVLTVFGAYFPEHVRRLHNRKERFLIAGYTEDAEKAMQAARVNLAPLRFGAGIKGKLILAMQNGTPSITTSIGAEGMHEGTLWNGKITDSADDFAKAAIQLYENRTVWQEAQKNGIKIVNKNYDKAKLGERLATKIKNLRTHLKKHRSQNFIGAMLQHQHMQATKYLSKWIELKNSKH